MLLESRTFDVYAEQGFGLSNPAAGVPQLDYQDMERTRLAVHPSCVFMMLNPAEGDADVTLAVTVEVHDGPPPVDKGDWDHIVEASVDLSSGQMLVSTIEENEEFDVTPGWYRVRSYHCPLRLDEESPQPHRLEVWPAPPGEVEVLKSPSSSSPD